MQERDSCKEWKDRDVFYSSANDVKGFRVEKDYIRRFQTINDMQKMHFKKEQKEETEERWEIKAMAFLALMLNQNAAMS